MSEKTIVKTLPEPNEGKKKIEFISCLNHDLSGVCKSLDTEFKRPSSYKEITLISRGFNQRKYEKYNPSLDVMFAIDQDGGHHIFFGHFNDGIV